MGGVIPGRIEGRREGGIERRKDGWKEGWSGARRGFLQEKQDHVSLQLGHFYCTIKYISLQMLPRNTIHEDRAS